MLCMMSSSSLAALVVVKDDILLDLIALIPPVIILHINAWNLKTCIICESVIKSFQDDLLGRVFFITKLRFRGSWKLIVTRKNFTHSMTSPEVRYYAFEIDLCMILLCLHNFLAKDVRRYSWVYANGGQLGPAFNILVYRVPILSIFIFSASLLQEGLYFANMPCFIIC